MVFLKSEKEKENKVDVLGEAYVLSVLLLAAGPSEIRYQIFIAMPDFQSQHTCS